MQGTQYATKRSILCRGAFCGPTRPPFRENDKHSIRGVLFVERGSARVSCVCSSFFSLSVETCHCLQIIQKRKWFIYNTQSH